jgi:hypothetical protein
VKGGLFGEFSGDFREKLAKSGQFLMLKATVRADIA